MGKTSLVLYEIKKNLESRRYVVLRVDFDMAIPATVDGKEFDLARFYSNISLGSTKEWMRGNFNQGPSMGTESSTLKKNALALFDEMQSMLSHPGVEIAVRHRSTKAYRCLGLD